jgi:hypothetical protein
MVCGVRPHFNLLLYERILADWKRINTHYFLRQALQIE